MNVTHLDCDFLCENCNGKFCCCDSRSFRNTVDFTIMELLTSDPCDHFFDHVDEEIRKDLTKNKQGEWLYLGELVRMSENQLDKNRLSGILKKKKEAV